MPLTTDVLEAVRALERKEEAAHRATPASARGLGALSRRYLALADDVTEPELRLALLAEAVRLVEGSDQATSKALLRAAEHQLEIVTGLASASQASLESDALHFLARANHVELLELARLRTTGMPAPQAAHVQAMEQLLAAARPLPAPFPRLLALERLAAALWATESWARLEVVVEELASESPTRWRTALHRAHLALAGGRDEAQATALAEARSAGLPEELVAYVWGLEARLATRRGDLETAQRCLIRRREAGSFLPMDQVQLPAWSAPAFVLAEEPRFELSIELWRRLEGGLAHARFVAGRLAKSDPRAGWRRLQAEALGVAPWRPHDELLAQLLGPAA